MLRQLEVAETELRNRDLGLVVCEGEEGFVYSWAGVVEEVSSGKPIPGPTNRILPQ
jgi:hypothetical protein